MRGKLKFSENIRYNCANKAKFYCEFDEFSENCVLNQLFYYVSNCLYSISQDSHNKTVLKTIIDYFGDIKLVKFDNYKCNKIRLTRQQQMFEKSFKLAKMFVENSSSDLYQVGIYCLLHDKTEKQEKNTRSILLYPKYPKSEYLGEEPLKYKGTNYSVSIKTINLMHDNLKNNLSKIVEELEKYLIYTIKN